MVLPLPKTVFRQYPIFIIFNSSLNAGIDTFWGSIEREELNSFNFPIFFIFQREVFADKNGDVIGAQFKEVGIDAAKFQFAHSGADFFKGFTAGSVGEGFAPFRAAAGEVPLILISVLDEQHVVVVDEHNPHADGDRFEDAQDADEYEIEGF